MAMAMAKFYFIFIGGVAIGHSLMTTMPMALLNNIYM